MTKFSRRALTALTALTAAAVVATGAVAAPAALAAPVGTAAQHNTTQGNTVQDKNKRLVQAAFDRWVAGGSFFDTLAPDVTWTITGTSPIAGTYTSRQQFLDQAIAPLSARLSRPITPSVQNLWADGDTVIALWNGTATARDGKPYNNTYSWIMEVHGAEITHVVAFFDSLDLTDLFQRVPVES